MTSHSAPRNPSLLYDPPTHLVPRETCCLTAVPRRWKLLHRLRTVLRKETEMIKTMNAAKVCTAMLLAIMLAACATKLGRDFDDAYAKQIKPGTTTKAEIREKLGRPPLVNGPADEEVWTYAYYEGRGVAYGLLDWIGLSDVDPQEGPGRQKRLVVLFKGDVVKSAKFTQELPAVYR